MSAAIKELDELADDDELLTQAEVAELCKIKPKTVSNWCNGANPAFPRGFRLGTGQRAPRVWRRSVIRAFIRSCEADPA